MSAKTFDDSGEANPYAPGKATEGEVAASEASRAPIHRALSLLIGMTDGATYSVFFGFVGGAAIAVLAEIGLLRLGGSYPQLAVMAMPVYALPCGILGGAACGILRATRLRLAMGFAIAPVIVIVISGFVQDASFGELILIGVSLSLIAVSSLLACYGSVGRLIRNRDAVLTALAGNLTDSIGQTRSVVSIASALLVLAGLVLAICLKDFPGSEYHLGMVAGAGIVSTLMGLRLVGEFPNRSRVGWITISCSSLAVMIAASWYARVS